MKQKSPTKHTGKETEEELQNQVNLCKPNISQDLKETLTKTMEEKESVILTNQSASPFEVSFPFQI